MMQWWADYLDALKEGRNFNQPYFHHIFFSFKYIKNKGE